MSANDNNTKISTSNNDLDPIQPKGRREKYPRIASTYKIIKDQSHYSVVVIGSGYGGSIAALRMAQAQAKDSSKPISVCLLERGREIVPGVYPTTVSGIQEESQIHTDKHSDKPIGKASALFDLRVNEDVSVMVGCGLGGTSLINANVSIELDKSIFQHKNAKGDWHWPQAFRENPDILDDYVATAKTMLGANPYPEPDDKKKSGYKKLNKFSALEKSAESLGVDVKRLDINVTFEEQTNEADIFQPKCVGCGDCCSGCNYGSKNTTLMNYLPLARNKYGAELYCETSVSYLEKKPDDTSALWKVHIFKTDPDGSAGKVITADKVILAAGTLGSTEIMLRSKAKGLNCSDRVGEQFSGNGDTLAFGYNSYWKDNNETIDPMLRDEGTERYESLYAIGQGDNELTEKQMPGPCTTGVIDLRDPTKPRDQQLIIEEGVTPGALSSILPIGYFFAASTQANFLRYGQEQAQSRLEDIQQLASSIQKGKPLDNSECYKGPLSRSQTYLMMSLDDSEGKILMDENDRIKIHWPDAGKSSVFKNNNKTASRANEAIQGQFIPNPLWSEALGNKLVSVHPLGGCAMGDSAELGVVNHAGKVFSGQTGSECHQGLYICDGAILPAAVGVNPLLTISAAAERICELILEENDWIVSTTADPLIDEKIVRFQSEDDTTDITENLTNGSGFIEKQLSKNSLLMTGGLANEITHKRTTKGEILPSKKEREIWAVAADLGV